MRLPSPILNTDMEFEMINDNHHQFDDRKILDEIKQGSLFNMEFYQFIIF